MDTSDPDYLTDAAVLPADQAALARHHTYTLFSQLFLHGVTADLLPFLNAVPELSRFLAEPFEFDLHAADFQHLFGLNLFPYESIFLDHSGLLGGLVTSRVARFYLDVDYAAADNSGEPDHIGHEMGLLAALCRREAAAWEGSLPLSAAELREQQRSFLEAHLLRWIHPLVTALRHQDNRFFSTLAELTLALIEEHYAGLVIPEEPVPPPFQLPDAPSLLQLDGTGLREIAGYLVTPVHSGIVLSRDVVGHLARQLRLPRGFGNRKQMLINLMRSAVDYDLLDAMLESLGGLSQEWHHQYAEFAAFHPRTATFASPWEQRSVVTTRLLAQIRGQIRDAAK